MSQPLITSHELIVLSGKDYITVFVKNRNTNLIERKEGTVLMTENQLNGKVKLNEAEKRTCFFRGKDLNIVYTIDLMRVTKIYKGDELLLTAGTI